MLKIKGLYLPMLANRMVTGDVYFLGSTATNANDDSRQGKTPERPFATLDYALSQMTASNDDLLVVMAGHSETITGAGGITLDKAGCTIVGMGRYDTRPSFLMDAANTVTLLATAANVRIENLVFKAGHADIATFGTITAKGVQFYNCHWEENVATENFVIGLTVGSSDNDSDGFEMVNCTYTSADTANKHAVYIAKNQNDIKICGNFITGQFSASPYAPIYSPSTEVQKNILIADNVIHNLHNANAAVGISIANTSSTGAIVRNLVGHQDVAGETPILAGAAGLFVAENYCSGVLGTASGYLYPAADS